MNPSNRLGEVKGDGLSVKWKMTEPARVGGLDFRNRLVRSATWEAMCDEGGHMPDELLDLYGELAAGGVGCIITGFTSVDGGDRWFGGMARLHDDALVPEHAELVRRAHAHGAKVMPQLALGGYWPQGSARPVEIDRMSRADLDRCVAMFADAARRAAAAGYDAVQVHVAHGFFLSRTVSAAHNHRLDACGVDQHGRDRLVCDIVRAVREAAPGLPVWAKVNCDDFEPGGLTPKDALVLCQDLADAGVEAIEVSGNGTSRGGVRAGRGEGYFLPFAEELDGRVGADVVCVGGWRSPQVMDQALAQTGVAALSLSRPLVREPGLPARWAAGSDAPSACVSCNACYRTPGHACIFNLRKVGE